MTELEQIVAKINKKGWLISGLYQRSNKEWWASLRPGNDYSCAAGGGRTMETALTKAMKEMKNRMTDKDWKKVRTETETEKKKNKFKGRRIRL